MDAWQRNGWPDHRALSFQGPGTLPGTLFLIGSAGYPFHGDLHDCWPGILLLVSSLSAARCGVSLAFGSSLLGFYAGLMRRVWG